MNIQFATLALADFTRTELRAFAKAWNVPCGKDKQDALASCAQAVVDGKGRICAEIMVKPNHPCVDELGEALAVVKVYSYKPSRDIKRIVEDKATKATKINKPAYVYNKV